MNSLGYFKEEEVYIEMDILNLLLVLRSDTEMYLYNFDIK